MTPIINPWFFYLVDLISNLKIACFVLLLIIAIGFGAIVIIVIGEDVEGVELDEVKVIKVLKGMAVVGVLLMTFSILLPSKETCYKMMVASQITDTNIQKAEDVIKDSVDYIFEKINKKKKNGETYKNEVSNTSR